MYLEKYVRVYMVYIVGQKVISLVVMVWVEVAKLCSYIHISKNVPTCLCVKYD